MVKKAFIHIGAPKTGTTSIQSFIRRNKKLLSVQGIGLSDNWGQTDVPLAVLAREPDDFKTDVAWARNASTKGRFATDQLSNTWWQGVRARVHEDFQALAASKESETLIFSVEHAYTLSANERKNLSALFSMAGIEATIVVYLRHPLQRIFSAASTAILNGSRLDLASFMSLPSKPRPFGAPSNMTISPREIASDLRDWETCFDGRLIVRLFDREHLVQGDLITDFCDVTGIDLTEEFQIPGAENTTLPLVSLKIVNELNKRLPMQHILEDGSPNHLREGFANWVRSWDVKSPKFAPTKQQLEAWRDEHSSSIEELRLSYFPAISSFWDADNTRSSQADEHNGSSVLSPAETLSVILAVELWSRKKGEKAT